MSAEGRQLDPEIAALLREVPRYQGLKLLSGPLEFVRGLSRANRSAGALRATSMERRLLETYREEVAWLLRQASVSALRSDPSSILVRHVGLDERILVLSSDELGSEIQHYQSCLSATEPAQERAALAELSTLLPVRIENATRFAAASLNLVPSTGTRICLALSMMHEGRMGEAKRVLLSVLSSQPIALDVSIAWNNLGTIYVDQGQIEQARDAYRAGAQAAANPDPAMSWLLNACQIADEEDALRAARHVDELLPLEHAAVEEHLLRRTRPDDLTDRFWSTVALLRDEAGPTSMRVLDV